MTPFTGGRIGEEIPQFRPFISGQIDLGGILTGTSVRTLDGDIPIEFLSPGDRIITRNSGAAKLIAIEVDTVTEAAVEFTSGSIGDIAAETSLILPASQPILLRDWRAKVMFGQPQAVCVAGMLIDHGFILDLGEREMTLHRLIFNRDQVVYAGGLELMSAPMLQWKRAAA
ncbi:MAG: Hint domain-containing protein [Aestuariivita sp.]|uniref:Hint domain-containing protein n=1 Tax=Aestuariivita sp. TaxID=1872407 RepID=UPI003BAFB00A